MLSTFFSTSKPVHYLVIAVLLILVTIGSLALNDLTVWTTYLLLIPLLFIIGLTQFITIKNELTRSNTYSIFIFTLFLSIAVRIELTWQPVLSLVLLLLALRRLLSLKNGTDYIKKIYDASFWITIASLIESWSSLFFITIYVAIFLFSRHKFRYWIIPAIAVLSVLMIGVAIDQFINWDVIESLSNGWNLDPLWKYSKVDNTQILTTLIAMIALICLLLFLTFYSRLQKSDRAKYIVIATIAIISLTILLIAFKTYVIYGTLFIAIVPSIFMVKWIQKLTSKLWKELLLWIPIILLVITFMII